MINFEWGTHGVQQYSAGSDVTVIVDVLSFSTCVDIVTANGAVLYPYSYKDGSAAEYAKSLNADLASHTRNTKVPSLSPVSLKESFRKFKNSLTITKRLRAFPFIRIKITLCACLRNFKAIGEYINSIGGNVTVIAAGEKWPDGSIRFAVEDFIGAGAVISVLVGSLSPEAEACRAFRSEPLKIGKTYIWLYFRQRTC